MNPLGNLQSFIFGDGKTAPTYEEVKQKRALQQAMMQRLAGGAPQNVGEGLNAIGQAIVARRAGNQAARGEALGKEEADKQWSALSALFGASYGGGPATASLSSMSAPAPRAAAPSFGIDPAQTSAAPSGEAFSITPGAQTANAPMAEVVRQGLIERGLPEHVAEGFLMNFQDESGLNPGINEVAPLVPGSRGGFGLAQWTGPRRRALEAFASERGTSVDDVNTQLDFLVAELQGPESSAAQSILSAPDAGSAAAAIVNDFLRPAEEHRARRVAEYTGGNAGTVSTSNVSTDAPAGMNPAALAQVAQFIDNPYATEGQKALAGLMMQRMIAQSDPAAALDMQMKRAQLAKLQEPEQQRTFEDQNGILRYESGEPVFPNVQAQPQTPDEVIKRQALAEQAGLQPGSPEYQHYMATGDLPDPAPAVGRIVSGEEAAALGLDPNGAYNVTEGPDGITATAIGGGGVTVNNNLGDDAGQYLYGTDAGVPAGWRVNRETGEASPIPGGPAAREIDATEEKADNKDRQSSLKLGTTLESLNLNIAEIEDGGLPVTGALGDFRRTRVGRALTGSGAVDFANRTDQVNTSAALSEVQNMRDNSPTGGAVGQLTDSERVAIGNAVTALNNSTSADEYLRAAKAYRKLALDLAFGEGKWTMGNDGKVTIGGNSGADDGPSDDDLLNMYGG